MSLIIRGLDGQKSLSTKVWRKGMADRQQSALMRHSGIAVLLFTLAVSLMLLTGCDRAGQEEGTGSWFSGSRVDTITVRDIITLRDTIVVVDTMLVEKKIILRDTILVEKDVIKRVEVPAEIPAYYEKAWKRQVAESIAKSADEKTCFSGLDNMEVRVVISEDAKDILSEQRAKDKFELTLRRHGVPLSDSSNPYIVLSINVLWNERNTIAIHSIAVDLIETLIFYRNQKPYKRLVTLWSDGSYGMVGKTFAKEAYLELIEENAERVANLYLSAN